MGGAVHVPGAMVCQMSDRLSCVSAKNLTMHAEEHAVDMGTVNKLKALTLQTNWANSV